ncbi:hypothetical protein ACWHAR_28655, partial [Bacillus sp. LR--39]
AGVSVYEVRDVGFRDGLLWALFYGYSRSIFTLQIANKSGYLYFQIRKYPYKNIGCVARKSKYETQYRRYIGRAEHIYPFAWCIFEPTPTFFF